MRPRGCGCGCLWRGVLVDAAVAEGPGPWEVARVDEVEVQAGRVREVVAVDAGPDVGRQVEETEAVRVAFRWVMCC